MNLFAINVKNKSGFINNNGDIAIKPQFTAVDEFHDGLAWAAIESNGKGAAGYINTAGDWVIEPRFASFQLGMWPSGIFSEGLAPVHVSNNKLCYINLNGEPVTETIYDSAHPFSEGRALVCRQNMWGYIDTSGNEVIPCQYGEASMLPVNSYFSEGLSLVRFGEAPDFDAPPNLGYINDTGETIIPPQFTGANAFSGGFAMVKTEESMDEYYFINKNIEIPFEHQFAMSTRFSEGMADVYDSETETMGYIDSNCEWVIEPQFEETSRFFDGHAAVQLLSTGLWGYINSSGELIIAADYNTAMNFKNGLARVELKDDQKGYINQSAELVWQDK